MPALLDPTPTGFLRAGEPHLIVSGAIHYFRVHPELWRDRLRRLVAMGCNTVETYVAWSLHQPAPETVTFEGIADLGRFLDIAAEEGLDAIVRPGPYICAEWENGGFPGWILRDRSMRLRTRDAAYLRLVDAWFDELMPVIARRQASRGGNVVMVQVENEYGSFGDDHLYLAHLRDGLRARGIDELLVTSDGPGRMWLTGGTIDGALATVNFGSRTLEVLEMARRELPDQPYMCMEFWNGWFDHWGEEHHARDAADAARELEDMLASGMSVNFYMAHGGTNLGLTAGANHDGGLQPTTTSYDYDAPIAEDGALTAKFHAFREVIARHCDLPPLEEHLAQLGLTPAPVALSAREVPIERTVALRGSDRFTRPAPVHPMPPAFEDVGLERGLLRLSRDIEIERLGTADAADSTDAADAAGEVDGADAGGERALAAPAIAPLQLYGLADRAWVFVDGLFAGVADGDSEPAEVPLEHLAERLLPGGGHRTVRVEILVENLARVNFGSYLGTRKGILGGVWHRVRYLDDWQADPWPLEEMGAELAAIAAAMPTLGTGIAGAGSGASSADDSRPDGSRPGGSSAADPRVEDSLPVLVSAAFDVETPADAHLDVSGAGHGVAYVNGHCVGRYWSIGPQQSLYVPAPWIHEGRNEVLLLDLEAIPTRLALAGGPLFD